MAEGSEELLKALSEAETKHEMLSIIDKVRYICFFRQMSTFIMGFTGTPVKQGDTKKLMEYMISNAEELDKEELRRGLDVVKVVASDSSDEDIYSSLSDQEEMIKLATEYYGYKEQKLEDL